MTKPTIVVTHPPLPGDADERVNRDYVVRPAQTPDSLTLDGLITLADGAAALLITLAEKLDADFFERVSPSVKVVATRSVGFDHIDVRAAAAKGIAVAYTPGVLTEAVADAAVLLLLGASRNAYEAQQFLRAGEWAHGQPASLFGRQLTGKVLGIFGMGRIGQALAQRARAFGMEIHYSDRTQFDDDVTGGAVFHEDPHELLRVSEFLSLHAPATSDTFHFIDADTIALLPPGAIIVNTARGDLIDDDALLAALADGRLAAVGLDVFEHEPNIDPRYFTLKNAFLMPHLAAATIETQTAIAMLALDNVDAVLGGRAAPTLVTT
jgi:lactate dehydrogenase-like 2-hydroxyacid dehydrogenase